MFPLDDSIKQPNKWNKSLMFGAEIEILAHFCIKLQNYLLVHGLLLIATE